MNDIQRKRILLQDLSAPIQVGGSIGGGTAAGATVSDAQARQAQIAEREEARQAEARQRLAQRQAAYEVGGDVDGGGGGMAGGGGGGGGGGGYGDDVDTGISDLISSRISAAQGDIGSQARKPMGEWNRGDWGKLLVSLGSGFANAKDGSFGAGLSGGVSGMSGHLRDLDARGDKFDEDQRKRIRDLEDMELEDQVRRRRTADDRAYNRMIREDDRAYDRDKTAEDRRYQEDRRLALREEEKADRAETRSYNEAATAAANAREDAKELRKVAKDNSRDYVKDYIEVAKSINKDRAEKGLDILEGDELTTAVNGIIANAYGIGALGSPASQNVIPEERNLRSGIE